MDAVEEPAGTGAYPPAWETDVVLADGHTIRVRPIVPADAERLVRFHERQSSESIYFRYFSPRPKLSGRDVRHLTTVDHRNRVAFVALSEDEIIGVARYERYGGTDTAEVAFFVDDAHQGRGLATLLLEYLVAAGQDSGLRRFSASTLPNNRKMLAVFQSAGYHVASHLEAGVVEVAFDIDPTGASLAAMDRRERAAEAASVRPMLAPRSVAVIGAGTGPASLGGHVVANLVERGFVGPVHIVNPHGVAVHGIDAVESVGELPDAVDLAVIATPAATVPSIIEECGQRSVRAVVVMSAGFAEAGPEGAALERASVDAARRHGMRLLGPNCLGLLNTDPSVRLHATSTPVGPPHGAIAMLAEAGTLSAGILDHAQRMGLGMSTMVAAGNRADVSASDLLSYWIEDHQTHAVLLYLAARHLHPRFVRAARAASLHMPVAALHTSMAVGSGSGRSGDAARRATAMFRQTGVISVGTLEQLFDMGRLLADQPVPAGSGVAVVGNSDGAVAVASDACLDAGLDLVPIGPPVALSHAAGADGFRSALERVVADERVHNVLVVHTPSMLEWDEDVARAILDASAAAPTVTFAATMLGAAGRGHAWNVTERPFPSTGSPKMPDTRSGDWRRMRPGAARWMPPRRASNAPVTQRGQGDHRGDALRALRRARTGRAGGAAGRLRGGSDRAGGRHRSFVSGGGG